MLTHYSELCSEARAETSRFKHTLRKLCLSGKPPLQRFASVVQEIGGGLLLSKINGKVIECTWVRRPCDSAGSKRGCCVLLWCSAHTGRRVEDVDPPRRRENMGGRRDHPAGRLVPSLLADVIHSAISAWLRAPLALRHAVLCRSGKTRMCPSTLMASSAASHSRASSQPLASTWRGVPLRRGV